jgi:DNA-binding GntR family transcriptional regulator
VDAQPAVKASARRVTRSRASRRNGAVSDGVASQRSSALPAEPGKPPICALPLPEQISDHLGHLIMNGEFQPGSRLKEEHFAELYRVSRGPVREAFRILERRGFVEIVPRHGARVRAFDPADLCSLFSVRAVLLGLAARQATEHAVPELIERLSEQVALMRRSAEAMDISPREHARLGGDTQHLLAQFSGNRPLLRMLEELSSRTLWRMAWCETPLDFTSRARRQQSARFWSDLLRAVKGGDAGGAECVGRALLEASRDHMLAAMAAQRAAPPSANSGRNHSAPHPEERASASVSKGEQPQDGSKAARTNRRRHWPPFETAAARPPQGEERSRMARASGARIAAEAD